MNLFYLPPIESVIKDQQERYCQSLEAADKAASSTLFVEFMLDVIEAALSQNYRPFDQHQEPESDQVSDQVRELLAVMGDRDWSAQALMVQLSLSHKPTFRKNYLNPAIKAGLVVMKYPNSPRSPKQVYQQR